MTSTSAVFIYSGLFFILIQAVQTEVHWHCRTHSSTTQITAQLVCPGLRSPSWLKTIWIQSHFYVEWNCFFGFKKLDLFTWRWIVAPGAEGDRTFIHSRLRWYKLKNLHQKLTFWKRGDGAITEWGGCRIEMLRNYMDMHTSKDGVIGIIFTIFCTGL